MAHLDPSTLRTFLSQATSEIARHRRVTRWVDWRARVGVPVALGAIAAGCGGQSETGPANGEGTCTGDDCIEECADGADNDGDGSIDCDDLDCQDADACLLGTGGTGGIGLLYGIPFTGGEGPIGGTGGATSGGTGGDPVGGTGGAETGGVQTGGLGGTGGGLGGVYGIPYTGGAGGTPTGGTGGLETGGTGNSGAFGGQPAYGIPMENCSNGYDDDWDGYTDCDDPDCILECGTADYAVPFEYNCTDGADNDYDNLIDCDDPDCSCQSAGGAGGAGGEGGSPTGGYPPGTGGLYSVPF
jgi:hypothetical protein